MLGALDVIWFDDETIEPPGPKMAVCVEATMGFYFRINSRANWQKPVKLVRDPGNMFLDHDSYLECGVPLELDDYIIDEALKRRGVIGKVDPLLKAQIIAIIATEDDINDRDRAAMLVFLA